MKSKFASRFDNTTVRKRTLHACRRNISRIKIEQNQDGGCELSFWKVLHKFKLLQKIFEGSIKTLVISLLQLLKNYLYTEVFLRLEPADFGSK